MKIAGAFSQNHLNLGSKPIEWRTVPKTQTRTGEPDLHLLLCLGRAGIPGSYGT